MTYDDSRDALYRPQLKPVFAGFERMPAFDADAAGFSPANAWWLSNAAHLAYYNREGVELNLARVGWRLLRFFPDDAAASPERSTEGFLARCGAAAVLSFRGT